MQLINVFSKQIKHLIIFSLFALMMIGLHGSSAFSAEDTTPDPIDFITQTGVELNTIITSNTVTITGITVAVPIIDYGIGSYSINGGPYTTANGTIRNGDTLTIQHTSVYSYSTSVATQIQVGDGFLATFVSVTKQDPTISIIRVSAGTGGTIDPSGDQYLSKDSDQIFTIAADTGYQIKSVIVDGVDQGALTSFTFSNLQENHTIAVAFSLVSGTTPNPFTFTRQDGVPLYTTITSNTVTITGISVNTPISVTDGSYSINGGAYTTDVGTITNNSTVIVRHFSSPYYYNSVNTVLKVGDVTENFLSVTLPAPEGTFVITARPTPDTTITGAITPSGDVAVNPGDSQTFDIVAAPGFKIDNVYLEGVPPGIIPQDGISRTTFSYTFSNVLEPHIIFASFTFNDGTTADPFSFIDQTAVPLNTEITSNTVTITGITNPPAVVQISKGTYSINGGPYTKQAGSITNGSTINVRHISASKYNTSVTTALYIYNVPTTFTSTTLAQYTITATAGSGGMISPSGSVTVDQGTNKTFTIAANSGYKINAVTVDGVNQGALTSYTFSNVQANRTISASFVANTFTLTATAGTGGTITPSGSVTVNQGNSQTFAIAPSGGYQIQSVTVDGVNQGALSSYTFSNVQANRTISASFSQITYTLTTSATNGTITKSPNQVSYSSGTVVTLTATANAGYQFTGWSGALSGTQNPTTITMNANKTVTANFAVAADITAPTVIITSPANGITVGRTVSVTVTVTDNVKVTKVELYVDGGRTSTSTKSPFTTKWSASKAAPGSHTLQCKAYDAAGNVGSSQIITVKK